MRFVAWLGVVLAVVAVTFEARELVRALPVDRITVALALGDNYQAAERLYKVEHADPNLVRLVLRANSQPYELASPQTLRKYADEARKHDDLARAFDLYTLAQLRGVPNLSDTIDEIAPALKTENK